MNRALIVTGLSLPVVLMSGTYRYVGISDNEVREIQGVLAVVAPGATVYIGGVSDRCICEDGPLCTNNVDTTIWNGTTHRAIRLSRIDGKWRVGPLMQWELEDGALRAKFFSASRASGQWNPDMAAFDAMREHERTRPKCVPPNNRIERRVRNKVPSSSMGTRGAHAER